MVGYTKCVCAREDRGESERGDGAGNFAAARVPGSAVTFRGSKIRRLGHAPRHGMLLNALVVISALLLTVSGIAQSQKIPSPRDVVSPSVYVSADPAARGVPFQLAVVFKIRPGFHVNAREKSADYLIATDLRAELPAGFKAGDVVYPKGQLHTFTFSKTPLNVYQGTVTLRMPVTAMSTAPVGAQQILLKLRYQACSSEVCLPPVTLEVDAPVTIASGTTPARAAHLELFQSQR